MNKFPAFYNSQRIGTLFYPDVAGIAADAGQANLPPATQDKQKNPPGHH
ncbi:MAG: hypothetical protein IPK53_07525 [bacterium]|nr:hypothetical protein [bacterium]